MKYEVLYPTDLAGRGSIENVDSIWPQAECHPGAVSLQSRQMSCGNV